MSLQKTDLPDVADDICQLLNWPSLPPMAVAVLVEWQEQGVPATAITMALKEAQPQRDGVGDYGKFHALEAGVRHWAAYLAGARQGGR